MIENSMKLSDTALVVLSAAAARDDRLAIPPAKLPAAARNTVLGSLLKKGLVEELPAPRGLAQMMWRSDESGAPIAVRITDAGLRAINIDPPLANSALLRATSAPATIVAPTVGPSLQEPSATATRGTPRDTLRAAAQAVLAAWGDLTVRAIDVPDEMTEPMARLGAALAGGPTARSAGVTRAPRLATKQAQVLVMLRRPEGASGPAIAEAMGWAPHTVRGFLAGLAKKGLIIEVLERVRQVGSNKAGSRGSYSVYRFAQDSGGAGQ